MAGRPPGAQNKDKPFRDALRRAIARAETTDRLLRIAEALLLDAETGNIAAIKEVADRLDGKPAQENDLNLSGSIVAKIERAIVVPNVKD